jgi:hypothetical protein
VWGVLNGLLTESPVQTNLPPGAPVPSKLIDRIVSLTETELVVEFLEGYDRTMKGKRGTKRRVN